MHILIIPSYYPAFNAPIHGSFFREQSLAALSSNITLRVLYPERITSRPSLALLKQLVRYPEYTSTHEMGGNQLEEHRRLYFNFLRTKAVLFPQKAPRLRMDERKLFINAGLRKFKDYVGRHGKPDIIHTHVADPGGLLTLEISKLYGIPYIITEHFTGYGLGDISQAEVDLIRPVFQHAAKRIVVSSSLGHSIESVVGSAFSPWTVFPNVLSKDFEQENPGSSSIDSSPHFTFLNVAHLNKRKDHALLIRSFAAAYGGLTDIKLRIGGGGPEQASLSELIISLGVAEQVTLLGTISRERCREEMLNCDVFVLSSQLETFGVVVIEALATGKPVIATRCGGPDDIINDQNGILVTPKDQQEMIDAMHKIKTNYTDYDAKLIREECLSLYGTAPFGEKLRSIYRECIESRRRPNEA